MDWWMWLLIGVSVGAVGMFTLARIEQPAVCREYLRQQLGNVLATPALRDMTVRELYQARDRLGL